MDAYQAVIGKRDRREYDSKPLPDEVIHRILQAGRMAGTSSNKQQLRFIALTDGTIKEELSKTGPGGAPLKNAPFAVAILRERDARDFDVGRAGQNMMVAAWDDGIFSCPIGIREEDAARTILGYPDEYVMGICVAFGYPQANLPDRESRPRLPMEEVVHRERW
jgi:nitroreductase